GVRPRDGLFNRLVHGLWEPCAASNNADCTPTPVQLAAPPIAPGGGALKLVKAGSRLGKLLGGPFPQKIGAGGKLQPYNPNNGRYLSPDANPGIANSPAAHFTAGFGQGFGSVKTGVEM